MQVGHERTLRPVKPQRGSDVAGHVLQVCTGPRPDDAAGAGQRLFDHRAHHVDRNGETDAVRAAGTGEDRRVDADQAAVHVHQRTTGIARIDRCIGLDEELVGRHAHAGTRQRRHDAGGHGLAHAERIADGQHQVAHLDGVAVAQRHRHQRLAVVWLDAQHREVGAFVLEDEFGVELTIIVQNDADLRTILDDVVVGDDDTGRIHDHAGAERVLCALARTAAKQLVTEEPAEERVCTKWRAALRGHDALGIDVDDARRGVAHDGREGHRYFRTRLRHLLRLRRACHQRRQHQHQHGRKVQETGWFAHRSKNPCRGCKSPAHPINSNRIGQGNRTALHRLQRRSTLVDRLTADSVSVTPSISPISSSNWSIRSVVCARTMAIRSYLPETV